MAACSNLEGEKFFHNTLSKLHVYDKIKIFFTTLLGEKKKGKLRHVRRSCVINNYASLALEYIDRTIKKLRFTQLI